MQKIYLLAILALINLTNANIGISPTYKNLEIKTGEQGITSFTFSNGGDLPLEIILSSTANFIKPEIEKITIEPKKGKLVNFIISPPLKDGEYSEMVKATASTPSSQQGMGVSQEIKAELSIKVNEEFKSNIPAIITINEENIKCGNAICENPFEAYSNCPQDCKKKENFNPLKYIYIIIPVILITSVIIFIKKR